jgi:hypothetical protein
MIANLSLNTCRIKTELAQKVFPSANALYRTWERQPNEFTTRLQLGHGLRRDRRQASDGRMFFNGYYHAGATTDMPKTINIKRNYKRLGRSVA